MFDILLKLRRFKQEQLGIEPTMMRIQPPAGRGDELKRMGRFQLLFFFNFSWEKASVCPSKSCFVGCAVQNRALGHRFGQSHMFRLGVFDRISQIFPAYAGSQRCLRHTLGSLGEFPQV